MKFSKYQGAGNDFVIIDNRNLEFPKSKNIIQRLCDRRFGIGADGLITLENYNETIHKMIYFNADGNEGSLCGNGSRCFTQFCKDNNLYQNPFQFLASDGIHKAEILHNDLITFHINDIKEIKKHNDDYIINTGSPHYCTFRNEISELNVNEEGKKIRNSKPFFEKGINVNFIEEYEPNKLKIRTYERGVESETLACGTGITAAAICYANLKKIEGNIIINVEALGGNLQVKFIKQNTHYNQIELIGPAKKVFEGNIDLNKIM